MPDIGTLKFSKDDFTGQDIASLPDTPSANGISAAELKARFDNVGKTMLALGRFNELVDALQSTRQGDTGAQNIKMLTKAGVPTDVQANLLALADEIATGGYGDMLKSVYDTTNSGSVDDADRLEGKPAAQYTLKAECGMVAFRQGTEQTIPTGASDATRLLLNVRSDSAGAEILLPNAANDTFTVLKSGVYHISGGVYWRAGVASRRILAIYVDGATVDKSPAATMTVANTQTTAQAVSRTVRLNQGDELFLGVNQETGGALNTTPSVRTFLSALYIPIG